MNTREKTIHEKIALVCLCLSLCHCDGSDGMDDGMNDLKASINVSQDEAFIHRWISLTKAVLEYVRVFPHYTTI